MPTLISAIQRALLAIILSLLVVFPSHALFLSGDWWDPTMPGVGTNRYAYSHGDPINFSDPNGHQMGHNGGPSMDDDDEDGDGLPDALDRDYSPPEIQQIDPTHDNPLHGLVNVGAAAALIGATAREAARQAAIDAEAAGATTGMASATVTEDGTVFTGLSERPAAEIDHKRTVDPDIAAAANRNAATVRASGERSAYGDCCAEVDSMSQAVQSGASLQGSATAAAQIGSRPARGVQGVTGTPRSPCKSCGPTINEFGGKAVPGSF